ncbi:4Fe-4S dicluster domain-containing protein [Salinarchaeum sp. IM2453]|uniref:4Fe-4S dicluster domain-containing protein n=1 Tax=Salinarchaeum sp. IM2453 TaxID=2862870 RepID=UPI001C8355C2|nr:4Fe-4S dicluster domain-containing protein [Salinarchaeum sp. IM2453]QZA87662.1 4Fe-4S dicluster domain-containing protein [Salinarchaeum sp. IM2453]
MTQMGMVIDLERCQGCRSCQIACKTENNTPRGAFWMNVLRYEQGEFPDVDQGFVPNPCHHCTDSPCTDVCPTTARYKRDEDGIVLTDYDQCIGCRYCEIACPYGVNYFQWRDSSEGQYGFEAHLEEYSDELDGSPWEETPYVGSHEEGGGTQASGKIGKCTFCVHRQDSDDEQLEGTTACQEACPMNVIHFGDMEDPESKPRQYLNEKSSKQQWTMLESAGTGSNITYLGPQPNSDARGIEDQYKDPEDAIEAEADRDEYLLTGGESA